MQQPPKIILTGGGSGGHIVPLLSLAHELKQLAPDCQITYIGHKGDRFDSLQQSAPDFDFVSFINGGKFRRYHGESFIAHLLDVKTLFLNFRDLFRVIKSVGRALSILRRTKPDVVFSKGGFVAVPVGIAARLLGIPIVTHDSDSLPGLANRIIGRWASINATGMPAKYYAYPKDKIKYVGIPVSPHIKKLATLNNSSLKKDLGLPAGAIVILISGGGNGSKRLNDLVLAAAPELTGSYQNLHIIHVAGQQHEQELKQAYARLLGPEEARRVQVFGFSPDFPKLAAAADVIVGRAGATSLAEFAQLRKACIIMPSPFLAGGHQLKNAEELTSQDAAVVVGEDTETDEFIAVLRELLGNDARRHELAQNIGKFAKPNAARELAKIILHLAGGAKD